MVSLRLALLNAEQDFFKFNEKYLHYVGLWPKQESKLHATLYKIFEIILHIFAIIYVVITGIGTYQHKDDTILLMSNLDKTLVAYNFGLKTVFFILKRRQLKDLLSEIKYSGDRVTEDRKKFMSLHIIVITILSTAIVSAFSLLAQYKGEMTVEAWMPFDPLKCKMNLMLAGQILAVTFIPCMYRAFAMQGLVCTIIMYFCDQLDELQNRMRGLNFSVRNENVMRMEFKEIIKKHVRLMRYSNTFTNIFKEFFLIQNLAVTIELCLNALMVTVVGFEQKTLLASFVAFLFVALLNAYIFCYLGDELIAKSEGIALAAYESAWTSWPVDLQKDLLIVIRAAQKPLKLSAGGMSIMCIQTYSQALYNAYSIFAVLNDVVD
ncbi:odorant receptor Or2-like [Zerene cesonia]|uniref:odorant receptor Or2-like n=1 Tax=Zerene cesonia TaxID=33412 RepID=UPI0018E5877E|nr:odorant receptor Or2-like [Zerene cesonia]